MVRACTAVFEQLASSDTRSGILWIDARSGKRHIPESTVGDGFDRGR